MAHEKLDGKWLYIKDPAWAYRKDPALPYPLNLPDDRLVNPETMPFSPVVKHPVRVHAVVACDRIHIPTLEGLMTAEIGDYIIRGVKGEYYPVKPDIFAQTYESASEGGTAFLSEGARRIILERHRQVNEERCDAEHDKQHSDGELVMAAIAYAAAPNTVFARRTDLEDDETNQVFVFEGIWPWGDEHDKRAKHGPIRRLEIAGALIAAEIDRLLSEEASHLEVPAQ